jgi:MOSC domain-containing protein YiiM
MVARLLQGKVVAVCCNPEPGLPKPVVNVVHLIENWGIEGDYHAGSLVRHRYLAKKDPNRPNLCQALLVDAAVFTELAQQDIHIGPGMMGENVTIEGIDVMQLPERTCLAIGSAVVEVIERRGPCLQLNEIDPRLLKAVVKKQPGQIVFKAGIMTRILQSGWVRAGDIVEVLSPFEILNLAQDDTLNDVTG